MSAFSTVQVSMGVQLSYNIVRHTPLTTYAEVATRRQGQRPQEGRKSSVYTDELALAHPDKYVQLKLYSWV